VLTGAGRAFTVGQDLAEFADPRHAEPDGGFRGLMRAVEELQLPLVAAVNGLAVGFGLTVLPWCDLVLVGRSARFRAPFIELGVSTEAGASLALGDVMGQQAANRLLLTGAWMDADEAVANGLALRVADDGDLLRDALELATTVASRPPNALRSTLALMRRRRRGWSDAVVAEYEAMARLAGGEENLAAISAFFDRS
jgi:enoyl-CoA hydratase/carnithine racemase